MKNYNNTIGNRTRDLPACSAVPQPTAPPRAPFEVYRILIIKVIKLLFNHLKFRHTRSLLFPTEVHVLEIFDIIGQVNEVYSIAFREQVTVV